MNGYSIEYLDSLPENIDKFVHNGHINDEKKNGIVCNYKPFYFVIKNNSEIIAALTAYTAFSEIYIDDLWVSPNHRKLGIGRKLLLEVERSFSGKGYNNINLVTSQFQAPEFYKKCGYLVEFVRKNKINPKLSKIFYIKFFNEEEQTQGILK